MSKTPRRDTLDFLTALQGAQESLIEAWGHLARALSLIAQNDKESQRLAPHLMDVIRNAAATTETLRDLEDVCVLALPTLDDVGERECANLSRRLAEVRQKLQDAASQLLSS